MNVIIVGVGDVGYIAAETIAEIHDVLIIEKDEVIAENAKSRLNVSVLHEDGTNPKTIEFAIGNHKADVIIATLGRDDSNLFICMMAKRICPNIKTIASVTNPDFMIDTANKDFGVDVIISPEITTAKKMYRLATLENAVDYKYLDSLDLHFAVFTVENEHPIVGSIVMNIPTGDRFTVFAIYRNDVLEMEVDTMEIHAGDRICVLGSLEGITMFNEYMGVYEPAKEFVILGGSIVGSHLARLLSEDPKKRYIKIIDKDPETCFLLAKSLSGVIVINDDYTDPKVQASENIFKTDCMISTSRQDDTNLLMCMSAQKFKARKIISRYFKKEYKDIFTFTGIESIIGYNSIVSDEITRSTVDDETAVMRLKEHNQLIFIHCVQGDSKLLDRFFGDIRLPAGVRMVAVKRGQATVYPRMDTRFLDGDNVIVLTDLVRESELARVFGKRIAVEL